MTRSGESEPSAAGETPFEGRSTAGVVETLARLLSIAAIYPPEHARVKELAEPVAASVRAACGDSGTLSVDVTERGLLVGGTLVTEQGPGVARLRKDLDLLGATCLVLQRDVTPKDLLAFAVALRTRRASTAQGQELTHAEVVGLPETISLVQRDFGEPSFDESEAPLSNGAGSTGVTAAAAASASLPAMDGVDPELRRELQTMVRDALVAPVNAAGGTSASTEVRTRRELVRAVGEALRRSLDRRVGAGRRSITQVIGEAQRTLSVVSESERSRPVLDALKEAIDLHLRDAFLGELSAVFEKGQAVSREGVKYELELKELAHEMELFVAGSTPLTVRQAELDLAHLGVYLQVLPKCQTAAAQAAAGQRIAGCLASSSPEAAKRMLAGWLRDLALAGDVKALDAAFPVVAMPLQRSSPEAVGQLLLTAAQPIRSAVLKALWPHMAVDLLSGGADRLPRAHDEEVIQLLARFGSERMRDGLGRLSTLLSMRAADPARRVFAPPRVELFSLYELLLEMREPAAYGDLVFETFQKHPLAHAASPALRVLRHPDTTGRAFLADLLRDAAQTGGDGGELRRRAAQILAGTLRATPARQRKELWVVNAISALRSLGTPESDGLLSEIRTSKRMFVLPVWPLPCRRAALAAAPSSSPSSAGSPSAARGAA